MRYLVFVPHCLFAWLFVILFVVRFVGLPDDYTSINLMTSHFFPPQLPELYAFVENFNKNNKKSNLLKTYSILPSEAQKTLSQNLNTMPFTSETDMRKDVQPVYTCKVLRKDEERPTSMTELLYCSLLTSSLSTVERLSRSQQRLLQYGIPPPSHTFPYEILINYSNSLAITEQKSQSTKILPHLGASHIKPEKFTFEDKISAYLLADPGNLNR